MTDLTYPLSPSDVQTIARVLGVNALDNFSAETVNTGGFVMNDIYQLTSGRVLCVYEYGVLIYPSREAFEDSADPENLPRFEWDDKHVYLSQCETLEQLQALWSDNQELIFDDVGSADELLDKYRARLPLHHISWVVDFIDAWDAAQETEREAINT